MCGSWADSGEGMRLDHPRCLKHPWELVLPVQTAHLVPPSLAERTTQVANFAGFCLFPCPWCLVTKGCRRLSCQVELSHCPKRHKRSEGSRAGNLHLWWGTPRRHVWASRCLKSDSFTWQRLLEAKYIPCIFPLPSLPHPSSHPSSGQPSTAFMAMVTCPPASGGHCSFKQGASKK